MGWRRQKMLFEDATGMRRRFWLFLVAACSIIFVLWATDFVHRVATVAPSSSAGGFQANTSEKERPLLADSAWSERSVTPESMKTCKPQSHASRDIWAYVPAGDTGALNQATRHCEDIRGIFWEAFVIESKTSLQPLRPLSSGKINIPPASDLFVTIKPSAGSSAQQIDDALASITSTEMNRALDGLENPVSGVCLDIAGKDRVSATAAKQFLRRLIYADETTARKACLIAGPNAQVWDDAALIGLLDRAVVTGFTHGADVFDAPAPAEWFAAGMDRISHRIPQEKRIVALGTFGEFWRGGQARSAQISYTEAMWLASSFDAEISFPTQQRNTRAQFLDDTRRLSHFWLLDAASFHNQLQSLPNDHSIAIWPIGSEDPAIWSLLKQNRAEQHINQIMREPIVIRDTYIQVGNPDILSGLQHPRGGAREISLDEEGAISNVKYERIPRPPIVEGMTTDTFGSTLVLTFNGMVSEDLRAQLLSTLQDAGVSATVFLSELGALKQSEALAAFADNGHQIGGLMIGSLGHSRLEEINNSFSLQRTQHSLAHLTGRNALLLRGAVRDLPHMDAQDMATVRELSEQGYVIVGSGISWLGNPDQHDRFLADIRDAALTQSAIILTLDLTGSHAPHLVETLPALIDQFKRDGFEFGTLHALAGVDAAQFSPTTTAVAPWRDTINYGLLHFWYFGLTSVFLTLLCIAVVRSLTYLSLSFARRAAPEIDPTFTPGVTILVPAYNEIKVIQRSIESILRSDYPNLEVLVVDDGSSDGTAQAVKQAFAKNPRVRLLEQENGGKWRAGNTAIEHVHTPIFVGVDADTILAKDAISQLVQHFRDEKVGAVAGFVEVGNPNGFLTSCQALEYIVSQAVTRRAFETFNGIFVVPGAIGAWRLDAVTSAGCYSGDTITEDADLTVAVHRAGYTVKFQENARAYTEAPSNVADFMKQRLRWTLGMLQTSWKHRKSIAEGRAIGMVSIVDAIWFSLLTSILSPLVDILLLSILAKAIFLMITQGYAGLSGFPLVIVASYLLLMTLDVTNTLAAFWFEKKFNLKLLLLTPILRFGYRQLLYISSLKALWHAITGRLPGWQKLERTAAQLISEAQMAMPMFVSVRTVKLDKKQNE